jgi:hypothetical protein
MLTAAECRGYSEECVTLAKDPKISYARPTILMAMSRNWTALAGQRDRSVEARLWAQTSRRSTCTIGNAGRMPSHPIGTSGIQRRSTGTP